MNDFGRFYYSARAFLEGQDMYGPTPATLTLVNKHFWNMNPPHFHLLLLPLAFAPPKIALGVWLAISFLCLIISLRLVLGELGVGMTPFRFAVLLLALLVFSGTNTFLVTGQVSLLLLLPMAWAWILARRNRWPASGYLLGAIMSIKPFMLIFVPYFIIRRKFQATATAIFSALICFLFGLLVFGLQSYRSWLNALSSADWSWAAMNASINGLLTRLLSESPYYSPLLVSPGIIYPLWVLLAGLVGASTFLMIWRGYGHEEVDRSFALLLIGSQLISPLGWIYYL